MNPDFHFLNLSNGRHRVHRRDGECSTDQCVYESDRFGAGSVMVCGRTQLKIVHGPLNAVKYKDNILGPIVVPFLQQRNCDHVLQDVTWLMFVNTF